jgi:hypothetical protein
MRSWQSECVAMINQATFVLMVIIGASPHSSVVSSTSLLRSCAERDARFYFEYERGRRAAATLLTREEAQRVAANVAKVAGPARVPGANNESHSRSWSRSCPKVNERVRRSAGDRGLARQARSQLRAGNGPNCPWRVCQCVIRYRSASCNDNSLTS